ASCPSRAIESLPRLGHDAAERIRKSVGEAVDRALAAADPQAALRKEVMDATDRFVLSETVYSADRGGGETASDRRELPPDHAEAVMEAGALRCFAKLRLGDFSEDDWYAHYIKVAEMNSQNVTAMVRKTVEGEETVLETSLHEPLTRTMTQVREALLRFPPRTAVDQAHRLTSEAAPARLNPTQLQVDRLTEVMSAQFEKLFTGQIYRVEQGPPLNRSAVFQLDAGLLYTMLSLYFRHPAEAWRRIMAESLGAYRGVMQDEEALLETARVYCQIWRDNEADGPLKKMLEKMCDRAQDAASGSPAANRDTLVAGIMEDARLLVGKIRNVVDERSLARPPRHDTRPS
ncbi:MAG: hypothetical protein OEQ13_07305, partial [Acidobacteriota bacterium]|nr:hypothetical protein [Acidobacteriota bacterium]